LFVSTLVLSGCSAGRRNPDVTNVVLISIDCLNRRQLDEAVAEGATPAFARLRDDSLSFSRAYSHAPWTTPSHASMFSGLYPTEHGRSVPYRAMLEDPAAAEIAPRHPTLPEILADAGYETVGFVGHGPISAQYGLARGFARYSEQPKNREDSDLPATVEAVVNWLDEGGEAPFFLFLHSFDLHDPRPTGIDGDRETLHYIDRQLGVVIAELEERDLYAGSLIILTGDHGSRMIRTEGKCCVHGAGHYEENLRVPLLVKLPGQAVAGTSAAVARHVDLLPTVADVLGLALPGYRGSGVSLLQLADGRATTEYSFSEADARCATRYALVSERFKYILTPRSPRQRELVADPGFRDSICAPGCDELPKREEFFDLDRDPFEEHDLVDAPLSAEQAGALATLREQLARHIALAPQYERIAREPGEAAPVLDPALRESLRKLGYLD
jgi:arylsulfatase A-like enzyme